MKSPHLGILVFALSLAASAFCSEGVDDVIKLQRSGVEVEVIQAFVQDSAIAYDLSADDIQKLEDANVPATLIVSMIDHGKSLRNTPVGAGTTDTPAAPDTDPLVLTDSQPAAEDVAVAPADGQANISTFYESLSPYGTWSQDENANWVWEPTDGARDPNWRPYANNGHWTWTDHGWYFESDRPYGWAAFHYGRWGYNREHRWSWAPDNVWGPAWVDWRQSDDHIGWAPLPFGSHFDAEVGFSFRGKNVGFDFHGDLGENDYCFVDSNRFLDVNIGIVLVPEGRRHEVYGRTKIINNTYVYNDNRIINKGISTTVVERATKRKIEEVKVEDARIAAGQPIKGERRNANTIVAYRPKVANASPVLPPAIVQRQKTAHTTADRKPVNTATAPKLNEQDARARLATEKAQRKNATSAVKNAAAAGEEEKQKLRSEAAAEKKTNAETERESKAKLNEAKAEAKTKENSAAVEQRKANAETEKESKAKLNEAKAEAKTKENSAAVEQRKANAETEKESKAKLNEAKAEAKTKENSAATERNAKNEAATEKKATAAEENAAKREVNKEAAQEKARETKDSQAKAAEERKAANKETATEKKAESEAQREERTESKAEKAKEAKEAKDAKDNK